MITVSLTFHDREEAEWMIEAAKEAAAKFERHFKGSAGSGMSRNRSGRYAQYMRQVVAAVTVAVEKA